MKRSKMIYFLLIIFVVIFIILNLTIGDKYVPINEVMKTLLGQSDKNIFVIKQVRYPHVMIGLLSGMALGMGGYIFQKIFHNPLASPDIIGITSGGSLFTVLSIFFNLASFQYIFSLIGSLVVSYCIYFLVYKEEKMYKKMILIGIGMNTFVHALLSFLLLKLAPYDMPMVLRWLSGSLNNASLNDIPIMLIVSLVLMSILLFKQKELLLIELGDEKAETLGQNVKKEKLMLAGLTVILLSFVSATVGPIASIAFLSGPIIRSLCKTSGNYLIHAGLMGALLLLISDFVAKNILPIQYPVGVVTGLIGAPYLLYLLFSKKRGLSS